MARPMYFVATLEHSADNCWARQENEGKAQEWIESMDHRAEDHGVGLHGGYVTPNEHRFYFFMEADSFEAVTEFLGSPLLEDHDGHIAPVLTLGEAAETLLEE